MCTGKLVENTTGIEVSLKNSGIKGLKSKA
jgi:hypothetical protein